MLIYIFYLTVESHHDSGRLPTVHVLLLAFALIILQIRLAIYTARVHEAIHETLEAMP
jgi:uncharacterized protein YoxC